MSNSTIRQLFTGAIAVVSVAGGLAYALIAHQHGLSPEPPAWLALLIGGAVTFYYGQNASLNGSAAALSHFAAAVTARRAVDPVSAAAGDFAPPVAIYPPGPPPQVPSGPQTNPTTGG